MAGESTTASPIGSPLAGVVQGILNEVRDASVVGPQSHWHDGAGQASVKQAYISTAPTVTSITTGANEADAQSYTEVVTTDATFTPAMKMVALLLSTQAARSTPSDLLSTLGGAAMRAMANQVDSDLCDLASGATLGAGATGIPLTVAALNEAMAVFCAAAKGASDVASIVLSQGQFGDARSDALSSQGGMFVQAGNLAAFNSMSPAQSSSSKGVLFGAQVFTTEEVQTSGSDRYGFVFRPYIGGAENVGSGLGGAMDFVNQPAVFDQRVNARAASSIIVDARYGVARENPALIRYILSAA